MRDIKNFEDYQITDDGKVWSKRRNIWMKLRNINGYKQVCLTINSKRFYKYVHRLVAEAFIPNPDNKPTVNHKNHIRDDNRAENLEWATYLEQNDEIMKEKVSQSLKGRHNSPNTEFKPIGDIYQYTLDGNLVGTYKTAIQAAKATNCQQTNISRCCNGGYFTKGKWINIKQHKGYKWSLNPL